MNRDRHHVAVLLALAATTVGTVGGCSRPFWRKQANRDAYAAITPKLNDQRWAVPRIDITPDPRSRMYDPFDPDRPPLPPDDPAAAEYLRCVNGMSGYESWHEFGQSFANENPNWAAPFERLMDTSLETEVEAKFPPEARLTLDELLELSYLHNRDYQTRIENLFLAALDLTFDRFQFAVRYLNRGGAEPSADLEYENVPGTSDNLGLGTRFGLSKLLPSGAQMAVEIANQTLWLFSGDNQTNSVSVLSYSMVQPLLFGAGRRVVLEDLTQSERNVLYAARDLARFRQEFFVNTVAGGGSGGFLGLLQQRQRIRNVESNIDELRFQLEVLTELGARPPSRLSIELRPTAAPLVEADVPDDLARQLSIRRLVGSGRVFVEWTLPMTEAQGAALETFITSALDDEAIRRITLALVRAEITRPARAENFVELERLLPAGSGLLPGKSLPGEFKVGVLDGDGMPVDLAFDLKDFGRYEVDEIGGNERIRLQWFGPMLGAQEDALLARSADENYRKQIERLAAISRASEPLDVTQLKSRLLNTLNTLRSLRRSYRDSLDRYKIELGLPPDVLLPIDECLLEGFQLVDARLSGNQPLPDGRLPLEQALIAFVSDVYANDLVDPAPAALKRVIGSTTDLVDRIRNEGVTPVGEELEGLSARIGELRSRLATVADRERLQRDFERDRRLFRFAATAFGEIAAVVERLKTEAEGETAPQRRAEMVALVREVREELLKLVRELRVIQIGIRVESLDLNDFDVPLNTAVATALENRVDLMNERAIVVDARRQVEVAANRLEAVLDVRVEGDIATRPGGNEPFDFRGARSSHRVGIGFTAPLDQIAERNAYRATIIALQRAKRDYTIAEDQVKFEVRESWRELRLLKNNFEVSRQALRTAARQLDQASEATFDPAGARGNSGLNLLNALNAVLDAQNDLINTWVDYERARLNIYRDMGMMEIGADGVWNESFYRGLSERCRRSTLRMSDEAALPPGNAFSASSLVEPPNAGGRYVESQPSVPLPLPEAAADPRNRGDRSAGHRVGRSRLERR